MASRHEGDHVWVGSHVFSGTIVDLGSGRITDDNVAVGAEIAQEKLEHRHVIKYYQKAGTSVATETAIVHIAYLAETVLKAMLCVDAAAAGDSTVTVDIKKSTGGGAFATILTGVYTIDSAEVAKTVYDLTLSGVPALVADDLLEIVVTATAGTGTLPQGLCVVIVTQEEGA